MRSKVQTITPSKAAELLQANTTNRPLSKAVVRSFSEAMRRGDWVITHQGIAFDVNGVLVDGKHRLAAIIEAEVPVELTVFTDLRVDTFDVLDTGKRRNAADVLAIEGEKSSTMLAGTASGRLVGERGRGNYASCAGVDEVVALAGLVASDGSRDQAQDEGS